MNNEQEDWKTRYESLKESYKKLSSKVFEFDKTNRLLEQRNKQLVKSIQTTGDITGDQFQKQSSEINEMGVEIGRLRTILRENNINVD